MPSVLKIRTLKIPSSVCIMPSLEQKRKIKTRFEIMSVPFHTVREDDTRGAKHGQSWWQYDHWKAKDATKGARKSTHRSIPHRWLEEEAICSRLDRRILSLPGLSCNY